MKNVAERFVKILLKLSVLLCEDSLVVPELLVKEKLGASQ